MRNHTGQGRAGQGAGSSERLIAPCTRRHWLHAGGLLLLGGAAVPMLAGCQPVPAAPLALGLNAWVGYDPLVLARDRQLIDTQQIQVVDLSSSSETLRHFRNGLLDAAALTLDEALRLADEGFDLRVVAVLDTSTGADVVLADPAIQNLAQLHGAGIAVEGTTVGALMLERLLQAAGLERTDVNVVNMEATLHLSALRSGRVSAAVSYEPVAGLLRAYRAGNVTLANAFGTGIADDKSIYPYVPKMIEFYLGEKPILQNVPTHICREPDALKYTLDNLADLVVKEVHGAGGYGMLVGPAATQAEIEDFRKVLLAHPGNYIAQPTLSLSTCPTYVESGVAPRHIDLRPFVLSGQDVQMVPGGLTRVALKEGSLVVNSSQGGGTKDTWVLEE